MPKRVSDSLELELQGVVDDEGAGNKPGAFVRAASVLSHLSSSVFKKKERDFLCRSDGSMGKTLPMLA